MPPYQGGGDMIRSVTFEKTTYNDLPYKFEAGTPDIAGGIGLGAAIDYLMQIGMDRIAAYEHELLEYGTAALRTDSRAAHDRHGAGKGRRCFLSSWKACIRTISERCWTGRALRFAPVTIARSR